MASGALSRKSKTSVKANMTSKKNIEAVCPYRYVLVDFFKEGLNGLCGIVELEKIHELKMLTNGEIENFDREMEVTVLWANNATAEKEYPGRIVQISDIQRLLELRQTMEKFAEAEIGPDEIPLITPKEIIGGKGLRIKKRKYPFSENTGNSVTAKKPPKKDNGNKYKKRISAARQKKNTQSILKNLENLNPSASAVIQKTVDNIAANLQDPEIPSQAIEIPMSTPVSTLTATQPFEIPASTSSQQSIEIPASTSSQQSIEIPASSSSQQSIENLSPYEPSVNLCSNPNCQELEQKYNELLIEFELKNSLQKSVESLEGIVKTLVNPAGTDEKDAAYATIGDQTRISHYSLAGLNSNSFSLYTNDLMLAIFGPEMLKTHVMIGNTVSNRPTLDRQKVNDIVGHVCKKFSVNSDTVKRVMQTKLNNAKKEKPAKKKDATL